MTKAVRENAPTLARDQDGYPMPLVRPSGTRQEVDFNTSADTAAASAAFTQAAIRVVATVACFYKIGANVDDSAEEATADGSAADYLPANTPYDWAVTPGHKISVINADLSSAPTDGVLYITELA